MKTLNPSIERLEERITPGGLALPTITLPTLGGGGGDCAGAGGGSSAEGSVSGGTKSTNATQSGSCHCSKHSC